MSREYAMSRVRDALEKSDGNHLKAQRLLLQWLEKDQSLLFGLVAPHLQSIISHAVNHAEGGAAAAAEKKAPPPKEIDASKQDEFGTALLKSLQGGRSEGFGFGQPQGNVGKPGTTSQQHIDTMRALAGAGKSGGSSKEKKKT